jgi:hypothetical protein
MKPRLLLVGALAMLAGLGVALYGSVQNVRESAARLD